MAYLQQSKIASLIIPAAFSSKVTEKRWKSFTFFFSFLKRQASDVKIKVWDWKKNIFVILSINLESSLFWHLSANSILFHSFFQPLYYQAEVMKTREVFWKKIIKKKRMATIDQVSRLHYAKRLLNFYKIKKHLRWVF